MRAHANFKGSESSDPCVYFYSVVIVKPEQATRTHPGIGPKPAANWPKVAVYSSGLKSYLTPAGRALNQRENSRRGGQYFIETTVY